MGNVRRIDGTTKYVVRTRHELRALFVSGDYDAAAQLVDDLEAVAGEEVAGECERWRIRITVGAVAGGRCSRRRGDARRLREPPRHGRRS